MQTRSNHGRQKPVAQLRTQPNLSIKGGTLFSMHIAFNVLPKTGIVLFLACGMNKIMKGCMEKIPKVTSDRQQDSPNKLLSTYYNKRRIGLEIKCHLGLFPTHPFKG